LEGGDLGLLLADEGEETVLGVTLEGEQRQSTIEGCRDRMGVQFRITPKSRVASLNLLTTCASCSFSNSWCNSPKLGCRL
jgi:hypothetical protein